MRKYEAIADDLRRRIRGLKPGTPLPTRDELAGQYLAAKGTVGRALALLRDEGWVETAQGARTVTLPEPQRRLTAEERLELLEKRVDRIERRLGG